MQNLFFDNVERATLLRSAVTRSSRAYSLVNKVCRGLLEEKEISNIFKGCELTWLVIDYLLIVYYERLTCSVGVKSLHFASHRATLIESYSSTYLVHEDKQTGTKNHHDHHPCNNNRTFYNSHRITIPSRPFENLKEKDIQNTHFDQSLFTNYVHLDVETSMRIFCGDFVCQASWQISATVEKTELFSNPIFNQLYETSRQFG